MLKNSKLTFMLESLMTRYRIGSFLVGDQIKFLDTIEKSDGFKSLPVASAEKLKDMIDQLNNGDALIKIVSLNQTPFLQGSPEAAPLSFDIAIDGGGGRYWDILTLPGSLINQIERANTDLVNVNPSVAPNNIITYDNNPEVVELSTVPEYEEGTDENAIPKKQVVHKMPTKDNKMSNKKTSTNIDHAKAIKIKAEVNNGKVDTKAKS